MCFIPDICGLLAKYNLNFLLNMYINDRCYLRTKDAWRKIIIRTIEKTNGSCACDPLTFPDFHDYTGLQSYKIVFIAKLWTTIPENKPRRFDLFGRMILDNIKHRLVECASTYSLKSDLLEDLYRNVSTEICNELALASKEDFLMMILGASPSSVMTNIYLRLKTVEYIYRCFHGPNSTVSNRSHL